MQVGKEVLFGQIVREKLVAGAEYAFEAVRHTFGSENRYNIIEQSFGLPKATTDGNTTLESLSLSDGALSAGLSIVQQAARMVNETCGDGSTLTALLTYGLIKESIALIEAGHDPITLKKGLEQEAETLLQELKRRSNPLKSDQEILSVAKASSIGNEEIASCLLEAIQKVGKHGGISIEEGKTSTTSLEIVEGMKIARGLLSPYFATNNDTLTCEYEEAKVLITDKKISSPHEIMPILQSALMTGSPLLIIADDFENETLATLIINKMQGRLRVVAIKAPGFGDRQKELLEDLALFTGATFVTQDKGLDLKQAGEEVLGSVEKLKVGKEETMLIRGKGSPAKIEQRIALLATQMGEVKNRYDLEKLEERKLNLSGKIALISVGAKSEMELKTLKKQFTETLNATKSAIAEGVLPGGAVALFFASHSLSKTAAGTILQKVTSLPALVLIENAGHDPFPILHEIEQRGFPFGFNKTTHQVENLLESGVLDPYQTLSSALKGALSAAATAILSEAMILDGPSSD